MSDNPFLWCVRSGKFKSKCLDNVCMLQMIFDTCVGSMRQQKGNGKYPQ